MATTVAGQPAPAGGDAAPEGNRKKKTAAEQKQQPSAAQSEASGEKKLSNAELKKKAKEEKAARRAAAKSSHPTTPGPQQGAAAAAASSAEGKGAKAKLNKHDGHHLSPTATAGHARSVLRSGPLPPAGAARDVKPKVPECFSHLSMARRIAMTHADKDVNPAVLALGQHMSTFAISDSITRLEATLLAFKKVIDSYTTPHGATFSRHFTSHVLNPQIEYLTACRPMCFSMGNAIRWLKLQISKIDIDLPDSDAKKLLCQSIDNFIRERIALADFVIVKTAADMVDDGEVVLTYARHHLVERALLQARSAGKRFRVILVDDAYERVGIQLAKTLAAAGVPVTYASDLGALRANLREATLVLTAAEAMFSNGAMYARAGTCDIATAATDMGLRVVALCESINFTERVSIDSLTYNEIDPERNTEDGFRLLFDTTRDKYISVVVTELGNTSAKSVPAILRKLEEL
ncbi:initiation factor 2 subunit family protein [Hirsutella rhossiliensis]|uniref:Translation initiation factor eIF2B subunit delta n=1 Tax=Hirsutella rhossiliensis TaxID=111463 RepID=A0A9P8MZA5_9HYPO|nr:initiation factor 2 subunit family domain-containing protein [Hirsutella rhossiliensis]KAH0965198.1 initiation factor 2 subunit family domain-containing protein [Hirsutella rhossiliensis]